MSWMSQNYHIASLAGGVLVLGGLGYMAQSSAKEVEEGFAQIGGTKQETTTVVGVEEVAEVTKSLSGPNPLTPKRTGKGPNDEGREVDLFTSVDLFMKDGDASKVIDLLQEDDVHPPIPNEWWVVNRVDPSWSDAPMQDEDGDGFFNGEEHAAKTDPSDPKSHGDLISKLEVVSVSTDVWLLDFSGVIGKGNQFKFTFIPAEGPRVENRIPASKQLSIGDFFYPEEPGQRRFKLLKVEEKEVEVRFGKGKRKVKRKFATVEDQRPNKKGDQFVQPYQMKKDERAGYYRFDHTVTFRLNAIGKVGDTFEIEDNETFEIPQGDSKVQCKLVGVKIDPEAYKAGNVVPESVSVEYGAEKPIEIQVN